MMSVINDCLSPTRVDLFLMQKLSISRSKIARAIDEGLVHVNGKLCQKPATVVVTSDEIIIDEKFFQEKQKPINQAAPEIMFEDEDIILINKPSGLVVHDADGVKESTLVDYLKSKNIPLADCCGVGRDGVVHRLDSTTTGVMVLAKTNQSAISLKETISAKETSKLYLMIVDNPLKEDMLVDMPIGRDQKNRVKMKAGVNGKESKTLFLKLLTSKNGKYELVLAKLLSGRTHQIRAHLSHIGRHIIGDSLYGFKSQNAKIEPAKVLLHSYILDIKHPKNDEHLRFIANIPGAFNDLLNKEFHKESVDEVIDEAYIYSRIDNFFGRLC